MLKLKHPEQSILEEAKQLQLIKSQFQNLKSEQLKSLVVSIQKRIDNDLYARCLKASKKRKLLRDQADRALTYFSIKRHYEDIISILAIWQDILDEMTLINEIQKTYLKTSTLNQAMICRNYEQFMSEVVTPYINDWKHRTRLRNLGKPLIYINKKYRILNKKQVNTLKWMTVKVDHCFQKLKNNPEIKYDNDFKKLDKYTGVNSNNSDVKGDVNINEFQNSNANEYILQKINEIKKDLQQNISAKNIASALKTIKTLNKASSNNDIIQDITKQQLGHLEARLNFVKDAMEYSRINYEPSALEFNKDDYENDRTRNRRFLSRPARKIQKYCLLRLLFVIMLQDSITDHELQYFQTRYNATSYKIMAYQLDENHSLHTNHTNARYNWPILTLKSWTPSGAESNLKKQKANQVFKALHTIGEKTGTFKLHPLDAWSRSKCTHFMKKATKIMLNKMTQEQVDQEQIAKNSNSIFKKGI